MKPQGKNESLLIKTVSGQASHTQVWDNGSPIALGHPFRVIIERTEQGARIRDLQGSVYKVTADQMDRGVQVKLTSVNPGKPGEITSLTVKRAKPITAPYLVGKKDPNSSLSEIFAYGGVRRSIISCISVHSAYVAYERGKPAFAAYREKDGIRIKTLTSGVRLKFKGAAPKVGEAGDTWKLTPEQLETATIFKGWYWWRFNEVTAPGMVPIGLERTSEENNFFNKLLLIFMAAMLMVSMIAFFHKPAIDLEAEKEKAPLISLKKKEKVFIKQQAKAIPAIHVPVAPPPPPPVEEVREEPAQPSKAVAKSSAAGTPKKSAQDKAAEVAVERSKRALDQAKTVKNALSSIKALTSKTAFNANSTGGQSLFAASPKSLGEVGKTAVSPMMAAGSVEVKTTGGGAGGKGKAGSYGGLGTGIQSAGNGNGSFVSLGTAGSHVDEGLSKDEVGAVIYSHMSEVRYCHQAAMLQNPKVGGKLEVVFTIDGKGHVISANVDSSTLKTPQLDDCVVERLKTWQFPKPRGGVTVNVSYPFMFKTMEEDR